MKIDQHWLMPATQTPSPNFDGRPNPEDITLLVVHCISLPPGVFGGDFISQLFCNQLNPDQHDYFKTIFQLKVSAHLLIRRDGEILQYVAFNQRAWHAGLSEYQGRQRCNDFSIGIELEGTETTPYTDLQYQQLAAVTAVLLKQYAGLSRQQIVGHSDIAPGRKTDPGALFDWPRFFNQLDGLAVAQSLNQTTPQSKA
ncbi:MAG: 1,6-anhydro-N-acetylmuramyl-L-alanine amidase AmpD [Methylococcaceae bacterium]|jgi:AmpD protein